MNEADARQLQHGTQLLQAGRVSEARAIGTELRTRHGRDPRVLGLLAEAAFGESDYDEAAALLTRCATLEPKNPRPHLVLGELYTQLGRYREAIARYDKVLKLVPEYPAAIAGKADAFEKKGDDDRARALLAPFYEQRRHTAVMSVVQARLDLRARRYEEVIRLVHEHLLRGDAATFVLWHLCFLLGQACERSGRYDEAFDAYQRAHQTIPVEFDANAWAAYTTHLIDFFSRAWLHAAPRAATDSERPVFIVGMPRSGSTLVESILAAHPQVAAAGEISALQQLVNDLPGRLGSSRPYPDCLSEATSAHLDDLAGGYLEATRRQAGRAARLTDKFLNNHRHAGLIRLMLPRATIIHCRRDPVDTCLSCYTQPLMPNAHPWAADLASLAAAYREYERLMAHWRSVLEMPLVEVQYEALVEDPESESRRLVEACGLPWDDACLRFHESKRDVRTASYQQVRQPVYRTSVGRAERFGEHLDPLRAALAAESA